MNEIKTHKHETHFNKKKSSIVNHIVTKSCVKIHKDIKNIMKKSLDEKRKCVSIQWKKNYIINLTINIKLIVKSTDSQKNMLNKKMLMFKRIFKNSLIKYWSLMMILLFWFNLIQQ